MAIEDLDAVLAIEQLSFSSPWKREHFLHEINSSHSFPTIAECGETLSGYACLTVLFEEAEILDIAVAPGARGKGIARLLMIQSLLMAKEKGAEVLSLEVRSTNQAAISLYEKLGFVRTGCRAKYYEGKDDAILMEKNLKETN